MNYLSEMCHISEQRKEWTPPDGGYGWIVALAGFLLWLEHGSMLQSGIFLLRVAPDFNVTNSEFNGLNSIQGSVGCLLGIVYFIFVAPYEILRKAY